MERTQQEREEEENHLWDGALWSRRVRLRFQPCCKLKDEDKSVTNSIIMLLFMLPGSDTMSTVRLSYGQSLKNPFKIDVKLIQKQYDCILREMEL